MSTLSSTTTGVAEGGFYHAGQHRAGTDVATFSNDGPAAQYRTHIDHGTPAPITAPILMIAPIIITALSPVCTWLADNGARLERAHGISLVSKRGIAEFLASFSTCWARTLLRLCCQHRSDVFPVAEHNRKPVAARKLLRAGKFYRL